MLRVLTYNTWHGLNGRGWLRFGRLESVAKRQKRIQWQIAEFRRHAPDLLLLQEVNPVEPMSAYYGRAMNKSVLSLRDNSGIKINKIGIPWNLDCGLAVLYPKNWNLVKWHRLRLSGDREEIPQLGIVWQLFESRSAILAQFEVDQQILNVINVHLHHGLERSAAIEARVGELFSKKDISEATYLELRRRMASGEARRLREIDRLLNFADDFFESQGLTILTGDLNAQPHSRELARFQFAGFRDAWENAKGPGYTWDPEANRANHESLKDFTLSVKLDDLRIPAPIKENLRKDLSALDNRQRRIDYVLYRGNVKKKKWVSKAELFGHRGFERMGFAASDHFGIMVDFDFPEAKS